MPVAPAGRRSRGTIPGSGRPGTAALAVAACAASKSVYFTTLDYIIRKLRAADAAGDLGRQLRGYLRSSILIIERGCPPRSCPPAPNGAASTSPARPERPAWLISE